jgi:hypothetical protein
MGGALEGDHYALPTAMAELVLRDAGFRATSLGTSIPADSLARAVRDARPDVFWLSVSHVGAEADFVARFATLSAACAEAGAALVVGGRALTDGLRQRMTFAAYGDTMRHLAAFAGAWPRASAPRRHGPS